jgi:hypothetical protein
VPPIDLVCLISLPLKLRTVTGAGCIWGGVRIPSLRYRTHKSRFINQDRRFEHRCGWGEISGPTVLEVKQYTYIDSDEFGMPPEIPIRDSGKPYYF